MTLGAAAGNLVSSCIATTPEYASGLRSGRVIDSFDYLCAHAIWPAGRCPQGWRLSADRHLFPDEVYRAKIERLHKIKALNHWTLLDLVFWSRWAKVTTRHGKQWDERKFLAAFRALRLGWPATTWALGYDGYAIPQGHPLTQACSPGTP